jgi:benzoylformate decarboxylase
VTRRGADLLLEVLASEGIRHVFGNPGTTELAFIEALTDANELEYVLALHEGVVIGMADGYAQVTHRPSFVNLHTAAGLGNAMGVLANAKATRTPMVVTAGQQHQAHLQAEPFLGGELIETAAPLVKWSREVHRVGDLGMLLRRAFRDAAHQPTGPVFVSIPMDVLEAESPESAPPITRVEERVVPVALDALVERILDTARRRFTIVAGDEVARSEAVSELVALAETLGCAVYGTPLHSNLVFPSTHRLWAGALPADPAAMRAMLAAFDAVLLIGDRGFMPFTYRGLDPLPDGLELLHLSPAASDLGRTYPASLAVLGDPKATLSLLAERLRTVGADPSVASTASSGSVPRTGGDAGMHAARAGTVTAGPMDPEEAVKAVVSAVPSETRLVDEGPTTDPFVRRYLRACLPDRFFYSRGGGLGWGMGAAMGVSLATGGDSVLCVVGDGSALYSPQALWTAVRQRLPVVFTVMNNGSYLILKRFLRERAGGFAHGARHDALDLDRPEVDFCALASAFGLRSWRPQTPAETADAVKEAMACGEPGLVDVPLSTTAEP